MIKRSAILENRHLGKPADSMGPGPRYRKPNTIEIKTKWRRFDGWFVSRENEQFVLRTTVTKRQKTIQASKGDN